VNGFPYRGDLLDVCGVRIFLVPKILSPPKYRLIGPVEKNFLMENREASQDARFLAAAVEYPSAASILEKLAQPGSGWKKTVFLEKKADGSRVHLAASSLTLLPMIKAVRGYERKDAEDLLWIEVFPRPGFAVFNESYAPGWHAWVDGKPAPILRAYGLFMAVETPAGKHWIDLRYEPLSLRLGLFLSLVSFGLAGVFLLRTFRSK
jgi:hypothetical protein